MNHKICAVVVLAALLILSLAGCDEDDDTITGGQQDITPPSVRISITSDTPTIQPGSELEVTAYGEAGSSDLTKIKLAFSGAVTTYDSSLIDPPAQRVTKIFRADMPVIIEADPSVTVRVTATDESDNSRDAVHEFSLLDDIKPQLSLNRSGPEAYRHGDTVRIYYTASDDIALYYMIVKTSGAFAITDTVHWQYPYEDYRQGTSEIIIPEGVPLDTTFEVTAELYDGSLNTDTAALNEPVILDDIKAPEISLRIPPDSLARLGDTLEVWVVGRDLYSLANLGISFWGMTTGSDSLISDSLAPIDSARFAIYIPPGISLPYYSVIISAFGVDADGNRGVLADVWVPVEGRIRVSQATSTVINAPIYDIVMDDARNRACLINTYDNRVDFYDLTSKTITGSVQVESDPVQGSIVGDRLVVVNRGSNSVSIIDLSGPEPAMDTSVYVSAYMDDRCKTPVCVGALANNKAYVAFAFNGSGWCGFVEVDLETYTVLLTNWGEMASPLMRLETTGNKRYALIASGNSSGGPIWRYDSQTDEVLKRGFSFFIGNLYCDFDGQEFIVRSDLYNNEFIKIGSVRLGSYSISGACFSYYADEIFINYGHQLGIYDIETKVAIEAAQLYTDYGYPTVFTIAVNAVANRFLVAAQSPAGQYLLYDIPVEPPL